MKNILKTVFLSVFFLAFSKASTITAQNTTIPGSFIIHGVNLQKADIDFYTKSVEASNFEQYRLLSEPVSLKFKNGFILELISAKELIVKNINQNVNINNYTNSIDTNKYIYPVFEIMSSGWITGEVDRNEKPSK